MTLTQKIDKANEYLDYMIKNKTTPYFHIPAKEDDYDLLFSDILNTLSELQKCIENRNYGIYDNEENFIDQVVDYEMLKEIIGGDE